MNTDTQTTAPEVPEGGKPTKNPMFEKAIALLEQAIKTLLEEARNPENYNINHYNAANAISNVKARFERVFEIKRLANDLGVDEALRP